ncbi:hypothetical protein Fmac_020207 [Flemingia macrophylla]|uniref:Uncharacterized protein n=1 Tax=Flemingia macrophylla TaxID=520843 RepID=A0ABD1LV72_9FABA
MIEMTPSNALHYEQLDVKKINIISNYDLMTNLDFSRPHPVASLRRTAPRLDVPSPHPTQPHRIATSPKPPHPAASLSRAAPRLDTPTSPRLDTAPRSLGRLAAAPSLVALPPCLAAAPRRRNLHRYLAAAPSRCTSPPRLAASPGLAARLLPPPTPPRLAAISPHPPNGGASGKRIDMIKVRIQLGQGLAAQVTTTMLKNEGVAAFYKVLTPFRILTSKAIESNDGKSLPLYQKALCGLTAGAIGAYCFDFLAWNYLFSNDVDCLKLTIYYEKGTSGRTRLVVVATQKFVAEVAGDTLQHCKVRQATIPKDKRDKQQKDKRLVLTMEDLSKALREGRLDFWFLSYLDSMIQCCYRRSVDIQSWSFREVDVAVVEAAVNCL